MRRMSLAELVGGDGLFIDGDWVESKDQDPDGDVRLLQLADVGDGVFVDKSARFLTSTKAKALKCTFLEAGDILVARMPDPLGRACVFPGANQPCVTVVDVCVVRPGKRVERRWLLHAINSPMFRAQIVQHIRGTTRQRISRSNLGTIELDVPPLHEQRRIADILEKADAIRRKRKEAIALTEELLRSAFLEMFGDPVTNPKGWNVVPLGGAFSDDPRIGTLVPAGDQPGLLVVRVGELGEFDVAMERCRRAPLSEAERQRFQLETGDVLLARAIGSEEHLGKASVVQECDEPIAFDSHVMRLRFRTDAVDPYFFAVWLRSAGGRARFMREAGRTAVQFNVNGKQMSRVLIPLPPIEDQRRFRAYFEQVRRCKRKLLAAVADAEVLFDSLVHRAFRGELSPASDAGRAQFSVSAAGER